MMHASTCLSGLLGVAAVAAASLAHAGVVYLESGDAGNTFGAAQTASSAVSQPLDSIAGTLSPIRDVDFFRFKYTGAGSLTVATGPYTNTPFPSNTFPAFDLFDGAGVDIGGFVGGSFHGFAGGVISYANGQASLTFNGLISGNEYSVEVDGSGQANSPHPLYVGDYSIQFAGGAATIGRDLPEPASLALMGIALVGLAATRGRKL